MNGEDDIKSNNRLIQSKFASDFVSSVAAGTTIAYTFFPAEAYKKYLQNIKQGVTPKKFYPYRGSLIFAVNIVPTTTIQVTTDGYIQKYLQADASVPQKIAGSFYCGVQGALFATVVENCILKQQNEEIKPLEALRRMARVSPLRPWKSYSMIATRDGIFTAYMLGISKETEKFSKQFNSNYAYYALNFGIGVLGTALSHPFDSIATHMQGTDTKISVRQAATEIIQTKGLQGMYKGFIPRVIMFTAFGNIIPLVKKHIDGCIENPVAKKASVAAYLGSFFATPKKVEQPVANTRTECPINLGGFRA